MFPLIIIVMYKILKYENIYEQISNIYVYKCFECVYCNNISYCLLKPKKLHC